MGIDYARTRAYPKLERIKAEYFGSHPDEPIILHRKDLIQKNRPFQALRDPQVQAQFDEEFLGYLLRSEFKVITVVIDKLEHLNRYKVWRFDPYHYCLEILLERYIYFLRDHNVTGDVLGEVRGGKPDRRLERVYKHFHANGTGFVGAATIQRYVPSSTLRLRPKSANVTGLQIADILAAPSAQYVRSIYNAEPGPDRFGAKIVGLLVAEKYQRDSRGRLNGFGIKWLP
jgi:hypothetical protein